MRMNGLHVHRIICINLTNVRLTKEVNNKRVHSTWLDLYKIQKQTKLIYSVGSQDRGQPQ